MDEDALPEELLAPAEASDAGRDWDSVDESLDRDPSVSNADSSDAERDEDDAEGAPKRRRRRRGGRRRRRSADGESRGPRAAAEAPTVRAEGELADAPFDGFDRSSSRSAFDDESDSEVESDDEAPRRMARSAGEEEPADEEGELKKRRRRRRRRTRTGEATDLKLPATQPGDLDLDDDEDFADGPVPYGGGDAEEAADAADGGKEHKNITSWREAIGVVIEGNLAHREARRRQGPRSDERGERGGRSGRPRGGRRRRAPRGEGEGSS